MKKLQKIFVFVVSMVLLLFAVSCNVGTSEEDKYTYDYIKITNIKEQTENYKFSFTVENISEEDITVFARVSLKTDDVVNSEGKKIKPGSDYTFTCESKTGKFYENPKGTIAVYNGEGKSVELISFEFDI